MCLSLPYEEYRRERKKEKAKQGAERNSFLIEKVLEMHADVFPLIPLEAVGQGSYQKGKQVKLGRAQRQKTVQTSDYSSG